MPFISSIRKNYDASDKTDTLEKFEITGGNSITTAGGYRIHTFSSVGDAEFSVKLRNSNLTNTIGLQARTLQVEYMVLAGGGAGGSRHGSAGGGAGGYLSGGLTLDAAPYPVSVGAGALGQPFPGPGGEPNGGSSRLNMIIALGGGRGAGYYDYNGTDGGCGGGGTGHTGGGGGGIGGDGMNSRGYDNIDRQNQGGGQPNQGFAGGHGTGGYPNGTGGQGGPGISTPIAGGTRGGGGGGAGWNPGTPDKPGAGGIGGGGRGGNSPADGVDAPGANTGSGGGGGNGNPTRGGSGSPGLVVVRYLT